MDSSGVILRISSVMRAASTAVPITRGVIASSRLGLLHLAILTWPRTRRIIAAA